MLSALSLLTLGFVLGIRHATDPDHVVAVSTIVSRQATLRGASAIGALWGIGHTATILAVGGAIIVFRLAIPPRLGLAMEFAVALMLIVLGVLNLSRHSATTLPSTMRPLFVGVVHGLAGSAFVAMLVLSAIPTPLLGIGYLAVFGLGTIAGMVLITVAMAVPAGLAAHRFGRAQHSLRLVAGVASIAFGLFLAHDIAIVNGLFSTTVSWTAR